MAMDCALPLVVDWHKCCGSLDEALPTRDYGEAL
jgi:hypothetical protein